MIYEDFDDFEWLGAAKNKPKQSQCWLVPGSALEIEKTSLS
jgi:hypothetical protein